MPAVHIRRDFARAAECESELDALVSLHLASPRRRSVGKRFFCARVKGHESIRVASTREPSSYSWVLAYFLLLFINYCCAFLHVWLVQRIYVEDFGVIPKWTRYMGPDSFVPQRQETNQQRMGLIKRTTGMSSNRIKEKKD